MFVVLPPDSRIGCYVTIFQNISNLKDVFYREMSKVRHSWSIQTSQGIFVVNMKVVLIYIIISIQISTTDFYPFLMMKQKHLIKLC